MAIRQTLIQSQCRVLEFLVLQQPSVLIALFISIWQQSLSLKNSILAEGAPIHFLSQTNVNPLRCSQ